MPKTYLPARDCKIDSKKGDCVVAELNRLRNELPCTTDDARIEALKFAVHFVGDIHQPLHTVGEKAGGNEIKVNAFMRGLTLCPTCAPMHTPVNFHAAWDSTLIERVVWDWGTYVDRLENGWLKTSPEAKAEDPATNREAIDGGAFKSCAEETHKAAHSVWYELPPDGVVEDSYFRTVLPILDRQLGIAGLARLLNAAYGSNQCPVQ